MTRHADQPEQSDAAVALVKAAAAFLRATADSDRTAVALLVRVNAATELGVHVALKPDLRLVIAGTDEHGRFEAGFPLVARACDLN